MDYVQHLRDFPDPGLLLVWWHPVNVGAEIYTGFYLCILPATVQSAIAFTSMAGGNVAAACVLPPPPVCWASLFRRCWLTGDECAQRCAG